MGFNNGMPRITTYSVLYAYIGLTILINSIFIMDIIYFCINTLPNNNYMLFIILLSIIETLFFVISKLIKSKLAYLSASRLILIFISFEIILLVIFCILTKFLNNFLYSSIICCILYNNTCILYSCPILLLLFLVILMIATKKWPFEIIESEHEISTGIFAEISSISYGLFVISEYLILIVWFSVFIKTFVNISFYWLILVSIIIIFLSIRSSLPNLRYTTVIKLGWKYIFPLIWVFLLCL